MKRRKLESFSRQKRNCMARLFSVVDNKFFSVLAAPNRELYLECIFEIYQRVDELEVTQDNTKEKIVGEIEYLIESRGMEVIQEDDATDLFDARSKARYVVNHIKECGWIYEEDLGHRVVLINFYAHATRVVRLLREIATSTQLEYTGYIKSIFLLTQDLSASKEIAQIEQMYKQTDELIANLKSLKSTIFTYYNNIVKKALFENAQQIFDELLRYKGDFFDKAYLNLKTYDNLSKYKDTILKMIRAIRVDEALMSELSAARMNDIYNTQEQAERFVADKLDYVVDGFNAVDKLIQTIDEKNRKYIQAAISKAMFFINRSDDFEGIFNRLVELINEGRIEYGRDYKFNLFSSRNLDRNSLWTAREISRSKAELDKIAVTEIDAGFTDEKIKELMLSTEFSYDEICKYAQKLLDGKVKIRASEMPSSSSQEFVKIILLYLYSMSSDCKYRVVSTSKKVTVNGVTFCDFVLDGGDT
jgi:hypothetical protein